MHVILCHPDDAAALWLHGALIALGLPKVELVAVEQLVYARRIVHRIDSAGDRSVIDLFDGRKLDSATIAGLVNRIRFLPQQHLTRVAASDRSYAADELRAWLLAWLDSLPCPVINRARPQDLGGLWHHPATVAHQAAVAGLPFGEGSQDPEAQRSAIVVFEGKVFGPILPRAHQETACRLAALLGTSILQIDVEQGGRTGWRSTGASGMADFRIGGRPLAAAVAAHLLGSGGAA
jgi:hypothetical protein